MKQIFYFLLFSVSFLSFANEEEFKLVLQYQIKSDSLHADVHKDSTRVKGIVKDIEGNLLKGAVVATVGMKNKTSTNGEGYFEMTIPKQHHALFCFKPEYSEIVTSNIEFKGGHELEIHFSPNSNKLMLIMDKPVIYMYSDEHKDVNLKIKPKGTFQFTYPNYNIEEGWQVSIDPDEGLKVNNQEYPYLFWEANTDELNFFQEPSGAFPGAFVKGHQLVSFLETKLNEAGLNPREKADFITYWIPRMDRTQTYFIQFLEDNLYENKICGSEISILPDNSKKIYMLFTVASDAIVTVIPQKLSKINRNGFVYVEWGGTEIPEKIINKEN